MSDADGSEDVNDFLQRIRELGDQRDKEDEERTRKLEEEILQGRKERQARRAERARSLSPTKDSTSNAGTPLSMRSTTDASMQDLSSSPANTPSSPNKQRVAEDTMAEKTKSERASPGDDAGREEVTNYPVSMSSQRPSEPPSSIAPLSRSGTLSWQQRPSSRGTIAGRNRPLSMVASENHAAKSPRTSAESTAINDEASSRSEIAQSLGAKDPAFFRQTEDRGLESAAYRKNQTDNTINVASLGGSRRLAGLAKDPTVEQEKLSVKPIDPPWSPPFRESSVRAGSSFSQNQTTSTSTSSLRSPLPTMDSQRLEPPASDTSSSFGAESISSSRGLAMSPSQGRMTVDRMERPSSPTKGLGGFVQSAMLKRSDSVNKRWSAQVGPGLSRGNSVASNPSGYDGSVTTMRGIAPPQEPRLYSASRETSPVPTSRPGSGRGDLRALEPAEPNKSAATPKSKSATNFSTLSDDPASKPAPSLTTDSSSLFEIERNGVEEEDEQKGAPVSPTKRWSPSKSSWLENAINKPDSPKPKAAPPQQPLWMADLNKTKHQRGSVDLGKGATFKEISTGGLMRSPPPGGLSKAPSIGGFPSSFKAGVSKPRIQTPPDPEHVKSLADETINDAQLSPLPEIELSKDESPPQIEKGALRGQVPTTTTKTSSNPSPAKASVDSKPFTSTKPKPETPPKKDFTSSLKPRKSPSEKALKDEPEFKNVFGKLKKTQTQIYVAPDELKDNIMRGKAGLASTSGPQKSERRDDFKDSILQKKDSMKAGLPSASTTITNHLKSRDTAVPEALLKRQGLSRSNSSINDTQSAVHKEGSLTPYSSSLTAGGRKASIDPQKQTAASDKLGGTFNASLANILSRGPSPMKSDSSIGPVKAPVGGSDDIPLEVKTPASSLTSQLSHMTKGRAKGPKRRLPTVLDQNATTARPSLPSPPESTNKILVDKTSGKNSLNYDQSASATPASSIVESRPLANISNNNRKVSQPTSPRKPSTTIAMALEVKAQSLAAQSMPSESTVAAVKTPPVAKQTPAMDPNVKKSRKPSVSGSKPIREDSVRPADLQKVVRDESIEKTQASEPTERITPSSSVKGAAALWQQPTLVQRNGARSPIKLPTRKDEEAAHQQAGLRNSSPTTSIGLGIETITDKPQTPIPFARSLPTPPTLSPRSPKSPPLPGKKPASITNRNTSNTSSKSLLSQNHSSPTSEAGRTMEDFFGATTKSAVKFNVDTQSVISSCSSHQGPEKIKTLRKQIFEVGGDGKLLPVPSHQEHILFEENLYVCTHVFGGLSGTRTTEVYLWVGDCVPVSAVDDAQLFARKVAKENSGKLITLRQGKETSNFFQALGGIVITRRGSGTRQQLSSGSSAPYMLCARRHVGQIAFDEVDFSTTSLCKGFPYIVSTRSEKLYLWKGSGSGADELGCARLIGMDLGLTGEIEEVDEGQEPPPFWQAFPGGNPSAVVGAPYWHLKSSYENYTTRLFTVEAEAPRPKSNSSYLPWGRRGSAPATEDEGNMIVAIKELMPFAQTDLADEGVYVLDTFFEIFVIVTAKAASLVPSFRAALIFAQEYAILIASAEDRPFVPAGSVVLGRDAPECCKRAFRKWEDRRGPCVVLPINEALLATRG